MLEFLHDDTISEIASRIPRGSWKPFIFTCKAFYRCNTPDVVEARSIDIYKLINRYPNKYWNMLIISNDAPLSIIEKYPKIPWHAETISKRDDLTIEFIRNNQYVQYAHNLSTKIITVELLNEFPDANWRWQLLSKKLPINDIASNMHLKWDFNILSTREDITDDIILSNPDGEWDWESLAYVTNGITICAVAALPDKPWDWLYMHRKFK